jgi:tRNA/tmRNA/rRNA uracil-C5-methylase (TrmA/RlmC/RlmD family)
MQAGDRIRLRPEKAVAGGRMLARHEGAIVLVAGAIPGELVEVEVEKVQRHTAWGVVRAVLEPSPDRVEPFCDWSCGGSVYAHVRYPRQLDLKREVVRDAFSRIAHIDLDADVEVVPSRADGYRMRARLHVDRSGRLGFYREGTHELCDPGPTGQLLPETIEAIHALEEALARASGVAVREVAVAENRDATERAVHLELDRDADPSRLAPSLNLDGITGVSCSAGPGRRALTLTGTPEITDTVEGARLARHARVFFQGNRYLLGDLVKRVCALVPPGRVLDLYSGVGLFAAVLAAGGQHEVVAVEGDRDAADDLKRNVAPYAGLVKARHEPVEVFLAKDRAEVARWTAIVDPPRTGLSKDALRALLALRPERIVYVSCDIATLARDAGTAGAHGYALASLAAFDMFPHTAHIESLALLHRR